MNTKNYFVLFFIHNSIVIHYSVLCKYYLLSSLNVLNVYDDIILNYKWLSLVGFQMSHRFIYVLVVALET